MDNPSPTKTNINSAYRFSLQTQNKCINSETLFAQGDIVYIYHQEQQYSLRRTRNGKLILTK
ncbi:MAG: hemin uptake protein HemP [Nitrosomonas sp.]|nr:hemin uptake protein HemP [Nitrosomonas sp.]